MADKLELVHHYDGGHGWVEVKRELLLELGIECLITRYSYQSGDLAFLEEDQDAGTLIKALDSAGRPFHITSRDCGNYAFIRNFPSYTH